MQLGVSPFCLLEAMREAQTIVAGGGSALAAAARAAQPQIAAVVAVVPLLVCPPIARGRDLFVIGWVVRVWRRFPLTRAAVTDPDVGHLFMLAVEVATVTGFRFPVAPVPRAEAWIWCHGLGSTHVVTVTRIPSNCSVVTA